MTSKYQQLRDLMGRPEEYNDKHSDGRVLKWISSASRTLADRKKRAAELTEKLSCLPYFKKVQIRSSTVTGDRISVYVSKI